jgi:hypothetical protein
VAYFLSMLAVCMRLTGKGEVCGSDRESSLSEKRTACSGSWHVLYNATMNSASVSLHGLAWRLCVLMLSTLHICFVVLLYSYLNLTSCPSHHGLLPHHFRARLKSITPSICRNRSNEEEAGAAATLSRESSVEYVPVLPTILFRT